jgi:guanine nucleotide-binding protein G(I)/G(S)/G(T) subunit beta-1
MSISNRKLEIDSLQLQIATIRKKKEDEIDWSTIGRPPESRVDIRLRRKLKGHFGKVNAIAFGNTDNAILSASQDGKLILWDAFGSIILQVITLPSSWVMACAFETSNGNLVASGGLDNIVSIHQLNRKETNPSSSFSSLSTGNESANSTSHPSKTESQNLKRCLVGHDGYISQIEFLNESSILSSSGDGTLKLWDVERGSCRTTFSEHSSDVMGFSLCPQNPYVFVSASCDTSTKVWDMRIPSSKGAVKTYYGHVSDINSVDFFPSGTAFASGSNDTTIRLVDLRADCTVNVFKESSLLESGITAVKFSSSGKLLFAAYEDSSSVIAWETMSRDGTYHELKGHGDRISCLALNQSGEAIASGSWDTNIFVWA